MGVRTREKNKRCNIQVEFFKPDSISEMVEPRSHPDSPPLTEQTLNTHVLPLSVNYNGQFHNMDNATYQREALSTLANDQTYEQYIDQSAFDLATQGFVAAAGELERYKKQLAYGKDLPFQRPTNPLRDDNIDILHAKLGIAGEAAEIFDATNTEEVKKEVGDILWYVAVLLDACGLTFDEVMQANIDKLRARYSSGKFTREEALIRADMGEIS